MASCIRNIRTKNYQNLIIGFQVTVENVGDTFLKHSVDTLKGLQVRSSQVFIVQLLFNL